MAPSPLAEMESDRKRQQNIWLTEEINRYMILFFYCMCSYTLHDVINYGNVQTQKITGERVIFRSFQCLAQTFECFHYLRGKNSSRWEWNELYVSNTNLFLNQWCGIIFIGKFLLLHQGQMHLKHLSFRRVTEHSILISFSELCCDFRSVSWDSRNSEINFS